jgi:heme oxygenase (biliverdin-IX-beta and delta-forming)
MILKRLREETSRNHSAIESQMPLLDPSMCLNTYRDLLARFWGFYAPLEQQLQNETAMYWPESEYIWAEREKTPLLALDLRALNEEAAMHPKCTDLPPLTTPAHVLGCLYVLEGASLGGQIISKHLHSNLGLTPESGAAFFYGYGLETGPRWQSFRQFLTSNAEPMNQDDEIVVSANATFRTLADWLFPSGKSEVAKRRQAIAWDASPRKGVP